MRKIVVPSDFSENAYKALKYAAFLYSAEPCAFYILHSFERQVSGLTSRVDIGKSEKIVTDLKIQSQKEGDELIKKITADTKTIGHTYSLIITSQRLPNALNTLIKKEGVELIVMGTKGKTAAEEVLLGNTTIQILKRLRNCPLLIIPEEVNYAKLEKIAYPTSFKHTVKDEELHFLLSIADRNHAQIEIIHFGTKDILNDVQLKHLQQIKNKFEAISTKVHFIEKKGSKSKMINQFVKQHEINLLVMIYYRYNFLQRIFRESIVKKIGKYTSIPYLVIPHRN